MSHATPTADPLAGVDPQHILAITAWATRHGAVAQFAGQVGFGRDCVGVTIGANYLDYSHLHDLNPRPDPWLWTPEDAYHKHDCMAVLGHGPAAVAQLYEWVTWLDEHGWNVAEEYREPSSHLDAVMHGLSTPKLMPPGAAIAGEYLIWSQQRGAWWRLREHGYTHDPAEAGRYRAADALRICTEANIAEWADGIPNEVMVAAAGVDGKSGVAVRHAIDEATRAMREGRASATEGHAS